MSLLIKGMNMPESCVVCPLCMEKGAYPTCKANNHIISGHKLFNGERDNNCPLVAIPTPHDNLIDSDQVTQLLLNFWLSGNNYTIPDILREIVDIPTIIEEEDKT